jgi:hypothetical protein
VVSGIPWRKKEATLLLGLLQLCRDEIVVAEEKTNPDKSEDDIYPRAETRSLLKGNFMRFYGAVLE